MDERNYVKLDSSQFEMLIRTLYLPQRIKIRNEYTEHSDQREDGDENLVACSAGN